MTKRLDEDSVHPSETTYDKAIKRMEERILNSSQHAGGCQCCRTNKSTTGTAYSSIATIARCHATIS